MGASGSSEVQIIRDGLAETGVLSKADAASASVTHFAQGLFVIYRVETSARAPFVAKVVSSPDMARAEWDGLCALREAGARVPDILAFAEEHGGAAAVLFLGLAASGRPHDFSSLVRMYSTVREFYGYPRSNYVGSLPQNNGRYATFSEFFWSARLLPQFKMAVASGLMDAREISAAESMVARVCNEWKLDEVRPRLIHGDLWTGNLLRNDTGEAVLIDPSVSFAHPEQDLAMLELFGSPVSSSDLDDIAKDAGLPPGRGERVEFFQIYPLLVHVNLFGASYLPGLRRALRRYS